MPRDLTCRSWRDGSVRRHHVTVTPLVTTAVEDRPRSVVRRRATVLAQQWRPLVDAAARDQRRFRFRFVAHARHVLHVAHVIGGARGDVIVVAVGRRADALEFTCSTTS